MNNHSAGDLSLFNFPSQPGNLNNATNSNHQQQPFCLPTPPAAAKQMTVSSQPPKIGTFINGNKATTTKPSTVKMIGSLTQ